MSGRIWLTIYSLAGLVIIHYGLLAFTNIGKDSAKPINHDDDDDYQNLEEEEGERREKRMAPQMCGGLSSVSEKDEHIVGVVEDAKPLIEEKTNLKVKSIDVVHYKKQVVAGMNYFVKAIIKTEDGLEKIAHLRIYKDIRKNTELTAIQLDKSMQDELVYFQ